MENNTLLRFLAQRGLVVHEYNSPHQLVAPKRTSDLAAYYHRLRDYSFRLAMRDVILNGRGFSHEDLSRFLSEESRKSVIGELVELGIVEKIGEKGLYELVSPGISDFGGTFEWFVAQTMSREFQAETLYGVSFLGTNEGGDYDVLSLMGGELFYIEAKSSPPKHIDEAQVASFVHRIRVLWPCFSAFVVDTHLRMKDKLVVLFEEVLRSTLDGRLQAQPRMERISGELFHWQRQIFLINTKLDLIPNLRTCLRCHFSLPEIRKDGSCPLPERAEGNSAP